MDDIDILRETLRFENLYSVNYFVNQTDEPSEPTVDMRDIEMFAEAIDSNNDDDDNDAMIQDSMVVELVDDSDQVETNTLRRSSTSHYGLSELFADVLHEPPLQREQAVERNDQANVPRILPNKNNLQGLKASTRESVAHSLHIVAKSAQYEFALQNLSDKLMSSAVAICAISNTSLKESFIGRNLCASALRCSVNNRLIAFDIYLITADYYYYILKTLNDAAYTLERAAECVSNDTRRIVGVLEEASKIYEEAGLYGSAIRVERRLELFDLSVDWIRNCRARQRALQLKEDSEELNVY